MRSLQRLPENPKTTEPLQLHTESPGGFASTPSWPLKRRKVWWCNGAVQYNYNLGLRYLLRTQWQLQVEIHLVSLAFDSVSTRACSMRRATCEGNDWNLEKWTAFSPSMTGIWWLSALMLTCSNIFQLLEQLDVLSIHSPNWIQLVLVCSPPAYLDSAPHW